MNYRDHAVACLNATALYCDNDGNVWYDACDDMHCSEDYDAAVAINHQEQGLIRVCNFQCSVWGFGAQNA